MIQLRTEKYKSAQESSFQEWGRLFSRLSRRVFVQPECTNAKTFVSKRGYSHDGGFPHDGKLSTNQNCWRFPLTNWALLLAEVFINREVIVTAQRNFAVQFLRPSIMRDATPENSRANLLSLITFFCCILNGRKLANFASAFLRKNACLFSFIQHFSRFLS